MHIFPSIKSIDRRIRTEIGTMLVDKRCCYIYKGANGII